MKRTVKILVATFLVLGFVIFFAASDLFSKSVQVDSVSAGISTWLLGAAIVAAVYAHDAGKTAHDVWIVEKSPFLRLQWNDLGTSNDPEEKEYGLAKKYLWMYNSISNEDRKLMDKIRNRSVIEPEQNLSDIQKRNLEYINILLDVEQHKRNYEEKAKRYNEKTDLQLVNNGRGAAYDVRLNISYKNLSESIPDVKRITAMGANTGCTRIAYKQRLSDNRGAPLNNREHWVQHPITVRIEYKDTFEQWHSATFYSDVENYNDCFRPGTVEEISGPTIY